MRALQGTREGVTVAWHAALYVNGAGYKYQSQRK
jgi:hypothetical protein